MSKRHAGLLFGMLPKNAMRGKFAFLRQMGNIPFPTYPPPVTQLQIIPQSLLFDALHCIPQLRGGVAEKDILSRFALSACRAKLIFK
eukprot:2537045-Amphidinium_carterae.1